MKDQFRKDEHNSNEWTPVENPMVPFEEKPKKRLKDRFKGVKRSGVALAAGVVLLSGTFGFGGGILASHLGDNGPVLYQSVMRTASEGYQSSTGNEMTTEQIAEAAANSVVEIKTETVTNNGRMQQAVSEGAGSGVIVSSDGYLVTNNHVIEGASKITVTLKSGDSYEGTLIGTDSESDVALVKIEASDLQPAVMGDSDQLKVGEKAVAIGNPLGELGGTVTDGIISALDREITLDGDTMNLLQTNAAINPGNSGGGLFNEYGELIGIVVAKSSGTGVEGLGFAIPVNDVKTVVDSLSQYGYVKGRVSLGVSLVDISSAEAAMQYRVSELGVYVAEVASGSGAEAGGIQAGDMIVAVDGTAVSDTASIKQAIKKHQVGDQVQIQVKRGNTMETLNITLGEDTSSN